MMKKSKKRTEAAQEQLRKIEENWKKTNLKTLLDLDIHKAKLIPRGIQSSHFNNHLIANAEETNIEM